MGLLSMGPLWMVGRLWIINRLQHLRFRVGSRRDHRSTSVDGEKVEPRRKLRPSRIGRAPEKRVGRSRRNHLCRAAGRGGFANGSVTVPLRLRI